MKKFVAEFIGTFTLVLFACGTAVVAGEHVGLLGISFAFGLALIAMAYGIGAISGCHINPAVSLGVFVAGRMSFAELIMYIIAQCLGAIAGAFVLYLIASGKAGYDLGTNGLGQNGWGEGYIDGYNMQAAIIFEFVATFLFVLMILGCTQAGSPTAIAGLAIGLTLVVIHIFGIPVTGVSVNPARSLGPALIGILQTSDAGAARWAQLPMFLIVPSIAGIVAGIVYRIGLLETAEQTEARRNAR